MVLNRVEHPCASVKTFLASRWLDMAQ